MNHYRYILEPYKGINSRYRCPICGKSRIFTRYIDTNTGQHLPEQYGRCERLNNCGYSLDPYKDGYSKVIWATEQLQQGVDYNPPLKEKSLRDISFIKTDIFHKSLYRYDPNNFFRYLCSLFHQEIATTLMHRFDIGSSRHWDGATVFWQVDANGQVRTGKVMLYAPDTGKREKAVLPDGSKKSLITWVHSILKLPDFNLQQCLFGLQQLKSFPPTMPVAIVESEKTAIIATVYLRGFIWLSCGSLTNLTKEKLQPLQGRKIALFPDLGAYERWQARAREMQKAFPCTIIVSDLLEKMANQEDRVNGLDVADYLIRRDPKLGWALTNSGYPLFWDEPLR